MTVNIAVVGGGNDAGTHAVTVRLIAPDNREVIHYRTKALLPKGRGLVSLQTALNDAAGKWTIRATDVASGVTGETTLTLR